jgi:hypothetical protein
MRRAIVVMVTGALLAACGGSGSGSSPSSSSSSSSSASSSSSSSSNGSVSTFCNSLVTQSQRMTTILKNNTGSPTAAQFSALEASYRQLAADAPADIKPAVVDLANAIHAVANAYANPSNPDMQALQNFATQGAADGTKITNYLKSRCGK